MANPKIENGYTKIANELINALCRININGADFMILMTVISKTYGWNKKSDQISITQFQKITGLTRPRTVRSIKRLVRYGVLGSNIGDTSHASTYWVIKDYDKWDIPSNAYVTGNISVTRTSNIRDKNLVTAMLPTKDNIQKTIKDTNATFCIKYFGEAFKKSTGQPYHANFGKDGAIFKSLLRQFDQSEICSRIDRFFQEDDDFINRAGYTVGVFKSRFNSLVKGKLSKLEESYERSKNRT